MHEGCGSPLDPLWFSRLRAGGRFSAGSESLPFTFTGVCSVIRIARQALAGATLALSGFAAY